MARLTLLQGQAGGFALVSTLAVMVLLVLVALSLLSLSTVEVRSSQRVKAVQEAKSNARLALMVALGELQKHLGPDQRISARAETLVKDPRIADVVSAGSPQAWWVGAMHSDRNLPIVSGDPNDPADTGEAVAWLVSGLDSSKNISDPSPFVDQNPVEMWGEHSLDLDQYTGGEAIRAGRVYVNNGMGQRISAYAYFVDDNGMKAQLTPYHESLQNEEPELLASGVLPGAYDLSILDGLDSLDGVAPSDYQKMLSLAEVPLLGGLDDICRKRLMDYTVSSLGVLSNVREGGLKKDLTIAFENESVFASVFPLDEKERYLVMDEEKLEQAQDLQKNGYIHWEMFKDYYNMKKHIREEGGVEYLDHVIFGKSGLKMNNNNEPYIKKPFYEGALGPHDIGDDQFEETSDGWAPDPSMKLTHEGHPYGDYTVLHDPAREVYAGEYKHSPLTTVLSLLREDAWLEKIDKQHRLDPVNADHNHGKADSDPDDGKFETHVQLWTSHYNPYNINLRLIGLHDQGRDGPRVINYPQVNFTDRPDKSVNGLNDKREIHVPGKSIILSPGKSRMVGFRKNTRFDESVDGTDKFSDEVATVVMENVWGKPDDAGQTILKNGNITVSFMLDRPAMIHGVNHEGHLRNDLETAQVFFSPFAWDQFVDRDGTDQHIGKQIDTGLPADGFNINGKVSMTFGLRTTREPGSSLRPLIDGNIRAMWHNPKWDYNMGLPLLASYSDKHQGESTDVPFVEMETDADSHGHTYWGADRSSQDGASSVILFDVPREDLVSLGQLQHAGCGRFSYEPSYIVGNSYRNVRIPGDEWKVEASDTFPGKPEWKIPGSFNLYDASYLINEILWDGYIFTTIPQVKDNHTPDEPEIDFPKIAKGEEFLPNPRFIPYTPSGSQFDKATMQDEGDKQSGSFYHNAGHLLVDGMFNVNSTSVAAWEAFLSGTYKLPVQKMDDKGEIGGFVKPEHVRFPRVKSVMGEGFDKDDPDEDYWIGFRHLEQDEVRALAEKIVEEIKRRGPFLTLGEFVNRKLDDDKTLSAKGVLQAALDATVNEGLDASVDEDATHPAVTGDSTQGAGFPGQLLQGDLLQALSPYMQSRSDSFTVRAYGESLDPVSGRILARAWCEAVVQRYPDPVGNSESSLSVLEELANPSSAYGRRFRMLSFRWLSPDEI
ncbi:hypothetical protein HW115_13665 [Verrucomicrobiaceae bacterium N1E253]|uniref:Uncharacterized protein n=1 Tax=Oceaniferula marina TaxID=2748318 RepID=A0A851GNF8_9BACT|nr:hypothetical protein [Oceaniferula marina]NWK56665.1 hypothetical protein [Oceaniferula marina]